VKDIYLNDYQLQFIQVLISGQSSSEKFINRRLEIIKKPFLKFLNSSENLWRQRNIMEIGTIQHYSFSSVQNV